jgi:hypothetical protein
VVVSVVIIVQDYRRWDVDGDVWLVVVVDSHVVFVRGRLLWDINRTTTHTVFSSSDSARTNWTRNWNRYRYRYRYRSRVNRDRSRSTHEIERESVGIVMVSHSLAVQSVDYGRLSV